MQAAVLQLDFSKHRVLDNFSDRGILKPHGTITGRVEIAVHPDECFSGRHFPGGRITRGWQAAVEMPSEKQVGAIGELMRKATLVVHPTHIVLRCVTKSQKTS